jgi:host factor-I protein
MKGKLNLQDAFLNQLRKGKVSVHVYLVNGVKLSGRIGGFDNFTVILTSEMGQQLVFKHAISSISPIKPREVLDFALEVVEKSPLQ